jgi:hypothetical protein
VAAVSEGVTGSSTGGAAIRDGGAAAGGGWQLAKAALTLAGGTVIGNTQSCERVSNGNAVI